MVGRNSGPVYGSAPDADYPRSATASVAAPRLVPELNKRTTPIPTRSYLTEGHLQLRGFVQTSRSKRSSTSKSRTLSKRVLRIPASGQQPYSAGWEPISILARLDWISSWEPDWGVLSTPPDFKKKVSFSLYYPKPINEYDCHWQVSSTYQQLEEASVCPQLQNCLYVKSDLQKVASLLSLLLVAAIGAIRPNWGRPNNNPEDWWFGNSKGGGESNRLTVDCSRYLPETYLAVETLSCFCRLHGNPGIIVCIFFLRMRVFHIP